MHSTPPPLPPGATAAAGRGVVNPPPRPAQTVRGCLLAAAILLIPSISLSLLFYIYVLAPVAGNHRRWNAALNLREISRQMQIYAADHNGFYPDTVHPECTTSTEAFDHLLTHTTGDEFYFQLNLRRWLPKPPSTQLDSVAPLPPPTPGQDCNTLVEAGASYHTFLLPDLNAFALVAGLTTSSLPNEILIMQEPSDSAWPPEWIPYSEARKHPRPEWAIYVQDSLFIPPGGAFENDTVAILRNDGSVTFEKIAPGPGPQPILPQDQSWTDDKGIRHTIPPLDLAQPHRILDTDN